MLLTLTNLLSHGPLGYACTRCSGIRLQAKTSCWDPLRFQWRPYPRGTKASRRRRRCTHKCKYNHKRTHAYVCIYVCMHICMHACIYVRTMQMVCMYAQAYRVKNRSLPHRQMVRARLSLAAEVRMCRLHQIFVWVPCDVRRWLVCACVLRDRVV